MASVFNNFTNSVIDLFTRKKTLTLGDVQMMDAQNQRKAEAYYGLLNSNGIISTSFNGETDFGILGKIYDYKPDYNELRARSWQAYFESDFAQIAVNRLLTWTIGNGLKLQAEPNNTILELEGYGLTPEEKRKLIRNVEARFDLYTSNTDCDWSEMRNYKQISWEKEKNAIIGGDVLVINRVVNGVMKQQIIDGENVQSPYYGSEGWPQELENGHRIIDGVEVDAKGKQVAYYVLESVLKGQMPCDYKYTRVSAFNKQTGLRVAYLYYGTTYRVGNYRGMPLLSACLQKMKEIDEYSKAALNQAKNSAKVSYQNVVDKAAEDDPAWGKTMVQTFDVDRNKLPITNDGYEINKVVKVSNIGEIFNNAPGNEVKVLENKNPLYFRDFFEIHRDALFAVLSIPPNVAMQMYNDSFSASRAAIMDWAHTLSVKRENHNNGTIRRDYEVWFYVEVLYGRINALGFLTNKTVRQAYLKARFIGANVPHIDPVKEVMAARLKAGEAAASIPFDDLESLTEHLGGGNSEENMEQMGQEMKKWFELLKKSGYQPNEGKKDPKKKEKDDEEKD
jgi:capsid protein